MTNHISIEQNQDNKKTAVISKAVGRAANFWQITNQELGGILGISESSVSRLKRDTYFLSKNKKEWELAILFLRAFRGLEAYLGGNTKNEVAWLKSENIALSGIPLELMQNVQGLSSVVQYIDCVRGR